MLIGDLAAATGASARSLRYYEEHGLIGSQRSANGYRDYAAEVVPQVRFIRSLISAGFSLQAIESILPCMAAEPAQIDLCPSVVQVIRETLCDVEAQVDALSAKREKIEALLAG
ncbi:MerR family transcriptional regulator [Psychromicrobium lacuslunae]|uniref:HTH merR-type domain-containing protein n=1 Tax=Psychromicrobium lacuslunae TaxID=1618207 RepID=A0A0D4C1Y5_9MICC|nr:MerR family transcriptional regulator [Psychromicrobium lacuslunae]AJT42544.1 hypothetical protein UM93_15540 [Psychromicrobium lacuslunae]